MSCACFYVREWENCVLAGILNILFTILFVRSEIFLYEGILSVGFIKVPVVVVCFLLKICYSGKKASKKLLEILVLMVRVLLRY
jgi:hypothetical protein